MLYPRRQAATSRCSTTSICPKVAAASFALTASRFLALLDDSGSRLGLALWQESGAEPPRGYREPSERQSEPSKENLGFGTETVYEAKGKDHWVGSKDSGVVKTLEEGFCEDPLSHAGG